MSISAIQVKTKPSADSILALKIILSLVPGVFAGVISIHSDTSVSVRILEVLTIAALSNIHAWLSWPNVRMAYALAACLTSVILLLIGLQLLFALIIANSFALFVVGMLALGIIWLVALAISDEPAPVPDAGQRTWSPSVITNNCIWIDSTVQCSSEKMAKSDLGFNDCRRNSTSLKRKRKSFGPTVRRTIWDKSNRKCWYCDESLSSWRGCHMHLDHKHPLSAGGSDVEANLVAACPRCNLQKSGQVYPELLASES